MLKFAGNRDTWKNLKIVAGEEYDKLIIFTKPYPDTQMIDLAKTLLFWTEPSPSAHLTFKQLSPVSPVNLWLPTWGHLTVAQHSAIMNMDYIVKSENISSVTSELYDENPQMAGYFQRLRFVDYLDRIFGEEMKLWGRTYSGALFRKLKSYRGEIINKYDALWDFKYHFACENSFAQHYFTEKITDPILAESLCFYDGCTNLEDFIDERAFIRLDLQQPELSGERIIKALYDDEWSTRIEFIRSQKKRLLTTLYPLNIIRAAILGKDILKECTL